MKNTFFSGLFDGFGLVLSSFQFISKHKMNYVYIFIIVFAVLWMLAGRMVANFVSDSIMEVVGNLINDYDLFPAAMREGVQWLAGAVLYIGSLVVFGLVGGSVILCVMSPLFSIVAEKSTKALAPDYVAASGAASFLRSIGRGIGMSLHNLAWQLLLLVVMFVLSFVPLVAFAVPLLTLCINAYYFGFSMTDYGMEMQKLDYRHSLQFAGHHRGLMIGVGLPFTIAVCIPWVGTYLALFFAPSTAVAGARAMHQYIVVDKEVA